MNYYRYDSSFSDEFNQTIKQDYLALLDDKSTEKTHFFEGRYENIYIDRERISNLSEILETSIKFAQKSLNTSKPLKVGFWFNQMDHGDITISHTHDEDDELLSGVYYLDVPEDSGDLVLGDAKVEETIIITPKAGEFIFFLPDLMHGVETNQSGAMRLSIGMNFGYAD